MRTERERRRSWRRRVKIVWLYIEVMALVLLAVTLGVVGGAFYSVAKMLPSSSDIAEYEPTEATKIISSDGVVLAEVYEENRELVPITDVPKDLQNGTVAIEDARFYKHPGVDPRGIVRAIYQNVRKGRRAQGGSTLTQQLARNIYLTREKKISRKLKEILLALELERNFTKEQILELYMNQVYYGSGSYGVQTASTVYFGKNVKDLSLAESALLAGLPQKPSSYSPYEDREAAHGRRNVVLDRMQELGYITAAQCEEAKKEPVKLAGLQPTGIARYKAPWFVTYVIKELTSKYGADLVYRRGLRVHTTLNYTMQKTAEDALRAHVSKAKWTGATQGALVCIDPENGYIKAMVGSVNPDFTKDQFNRAVQAKRQPGSSFKAFVYTAAVDNGYDINYTISNERTTYKGYGDKGWSPRNYDGRYGGHLTMRQAVARSVNVCAVRMADQIGIDQVITYARMLGIKSPLDRTLSLALGASVVTPLEMCSAYGVFAANGMRAEPMSIVRINESEENKDGAVIEQNRPVVHQVLSEQTAQLMNELFRGVVTMGTGSKAGDIPDAHGKTGTTQSDRDAWWLGYTPELVAAVWVGNDDYSPMKHAYGGGVCAPTWVDFMKKALPEHKRETEAEKPKEPLIRREADQKDKPPEKPEARPRRNMIRICADSGLLATPNCPVTREVPYDPSSGPLQSCPIHGPRQPASGEQTPAATPEAATSPRAPPVPPRTVPPKPAPPPPSQRYVTVTICVDSGQIANEYCPETVTRRFLMSEAPSKTCRLHRPPE
ncbi:MAG TPA: penicillin-binding protein 1A [Armatimonadota bacterium]|nr:penicillin-binding protein 1A [Armatimonadota bacterium]